MTDDSKYDIEIEVETQYVEDRSSVPDNRYLFSYTITMRNTGRVSARLISRHWVITDAKGKVQEVRGQGVVGEQPYLKPGEGFRYTSGTLLATRTGTMHGSYQMIADDGHKFDAPIEPFTLAVPRTLH